MTTREESHASNRLRVCIGCKRKGKRSLSSEDIKLVQKHILPNFDVDSQLFQQAFVIVATY